MVKYMLMINDCEDSLEAVNTPLDYTFYIHVFNPLYLL